jgi:hypothetical protein
VHGFSINHTDYYPCIKLFKMAISYRLPKIDNIDAVSVLETPLAADTALASGLLTVLDEGGNVAIQVKASDLLSFSYDAYAAGTASVEKVTLTGVTMVANTQYTLTIHAPYVQNFFAGGQETGAIFQTRTYTVGVDATPTVDELGALFAARIAADVNAFFTASYNAGTNELTITAASAFAGALQVTAPRGAVVATVTPWVEPVGSSAEVLGYVNNASLVVAGATYNRFIIRYRRLVRHNAVTGLQVIRPVNSLVYLNTADGGTAAAVSLLTDILDGSYTPVADYLGCPQV